MHFYILSDPEKQNHCKVGITKNLNQRLRSYRTACPQCSFFNTYSIDDVNPKRIEKKIIETIKSVFNVDREYVHGPPVFVDRIVEEVLNEH